ncbi:hypothetical protein [Neisseria bacilliformis]|uniref:hypothetical protein n=1 Tax=Neisseria bacilliformis TaxID=267212 RepID=UPI0028E5D4D6|nr:hypothetical protein [Neisseria bacilliformis]
MSDTCIRHPARQGKPAENVGFKNPTYEFRASLHRKPRAWLRHTPYLSGKRPSENP